MLGPVAARRGASLPVQGPRCQAWFGVLGFVAGSALAPPSAAAESTLELGWQAPPECGQPAEVERKVANMVHAPGRPPLRAAVTIGKSGGEYVGALHVAGAERRLTAPDCQAVVDAAAVILALAIDPRAQAGGPHASESPRESSPARARFSLGAATVLDTASLPHLASGVAVRAGLSTARWSSELALTYWLPQEATLADDPTRGGSFSFWTAAISGCYSPIAGRLRLSACLGPELGRMAGTGTGVASEKTAVATSLAANAALALESALNERWALRAGAGMGVLLLGQHPFVLETTAGEQQVHQPGLFTFRADLGLTARF